MTTLTTSVTIQAPKPIKAVSNPLDKEKGVPVSAAAKIATLAGNPLPLADRDLEPLSPALDAAPVARGAGTLSPSPHPERGPPSYRPDSPFSPPSSDTSLSAGSISISSLSELSTDEISDDHAAMLDTPPGSPAPAAARLSREAPAPAKREPSFFTFSRVDQRLSAVNKLSLSRKEEVVSEPSKRGRSGFGVELVFPRNSTIPTRRISANQLLALETLQAHLIDKATEKFNATPPEQGISRGESGKSLDYRAPHGSCTNLAKRVMLRNTAMKSTCSLADLPTRWG